MNIDLFGIIHQGLPSLTRRGQGWSRSRLDCRTNEIAPSRSPYGPPWQGEGQLLVLHEKINRIYRCRYVAMTVVSATLLGTMLYAPMPGFCETAKSADINTLTLKDAISTAVTGNRLLKNAEIEVSKAQSAVAITRTKKLPNISLTAAGSQMLAPVDFKFSEGMFGNFPVIGPVPSIDTTVSVPANFSVIANATILQPITQLKRINLGVKMQEASTDIKREDWRSQRNALVANVKQLYYGLAQLQSAKSTIEESIKFLTELERVAENNLNQGTILDSDLLVVQARLTRQKHEEAVIDSSILTTKNKLNAALGRETSTDFNIEPVQESAAPTQTLSEIQTYALDHRPEIRQASLKMQIAKYDEKSKRSESSPDVSLGVTYTRLQNIDVVPEQLLTAGVILTWNEPFDWGKGRHERLEKTRTVEQADNGLQESKSQVTVDVSAKYHELMDALSLLDVDKAEVNANQEKRRITMNRYKENASLLKDVLEADTTLADANRRYLQDQLAVSAARARLDQAIGED